VPNNDGFGSTNGNRNLDVDVAYWKRYQRRLRHHSDRPGLGIFDSQAILNDVGSGIGTGELCGHALTIGTGGTCGRIGTGYHWTAFNSRFEYDTPDLGGFSGRVGLFDPTNVGLKFK